MTLRGQRLAAGVARMEVARALGVSEQHYSKMELGRHPLRQDQIRTIKDRYGWEVSVTQPLVSGGINRESQPAAQGELLAMVGLAAYQGELPRDWRKRRRHPALWIGAMSAAAAQIEAKLGGARG